MLKPLFLLCKQPRYSVRGHKARDKSDVGTAALSLLLSQRKHHLPCGNHLLERRLLYKAVLPGVSALDLIDICALRGNDPALL